MEGARKREQNSCRLFKNNVVYLNRTRHTPYLLCLQLGTPARKARPTFVAGLGRNLLGDAWISYFFFVLP